MLTTLDLTIGRDHSAVHLEIRRSKPVPSHPYLGAVTVILIAPMIILFASAAVASATGNSQFDLPSRIAVVPPLAIATVLICPLLAIVLLAVARVRVGVTRGEGGWHGRVSLQLTKSECVAAILALSLIAVFVAHLVADGFACVNGVHRAC